MVDEYVLIEALEEKRFKEIPFYGKGTRHNEGWVNHPSRGRAVMDFESQLEKLNSDDIKKINEYINKKNRGVRTIIAQNYEPFSNPLKRPDKNNKVLIELDLSKPLAEIEKFIKVIKDDFTNTNKIKTIYDLLGSENTMFVAELHEYNVYKKINRASKSNLDMLADTLFIYDCIKADLDEGTIIALLNNHYDPVKMNITSLRAYYKLACDFIDNERYKKFISGYSTS